MAKAEEKYAAHNYFFSRPMQGLPEDIALQYENIIYKIANRLRDEKNCSSYFSKKNDIDNTDGFSFNRMAIIKQCKHFVFIYPEIQDKSLAPSGCLIELGGALAYNKKIVLFIHQNATIPSYIKDLAKAGFQKIEYSTIEDLKNKMIKLFF